MSKIRTVLVVDDNEGDHIIAKFALEDFDESIEIISAYDGLEALGLLEKLEYSPDLILLDINMPEMDGLEFLQEYGKGEGHSSVVVMLTSSGQYSDKDSCLSYPFVKQYIVKPLEKDHLDKIAEAFF